MLVIGVNIHIIAPKVRTAVKEGNSSFIQGLAKEQVEHGADVLDLNIGPQKRRGVEVMEWIVNAVQEITNVPLSLDTTNAAALEAGATLFVTNDRQLTKVDQIQVLVLSDYTA